MSIAFADFIRFFAEMRRTRGNYDCPVCGSPTFFSNDDANKEVAELSTPIVGQPGYHGFYSISCYKCGKAEFFHKAKVEDWLKNNPKPEN